MWHNLDSDSSLFTPFPMSLFLFRFLFRSFTPCHCTDTSTRPIATSTLHNHAMEPVLFAALLMLFITKFTALTAVTVYFINS